MTGHVCGVCGVCPQPATANASGTSSMYIMDPYNPQTRAFVFDQMTKNYIKYASHPHPHPPPPPPPPPLHPIHSDAHVHACACQRAPDTMALRLKCGLV